jgi:hypothetical protein
MTIQIDPDGFPAYQIFLYDRALHPLMFPFRGRRVIRYGEYEFEAWILPGGHVLRFELGGLCAVELVTHQAAGLPHDGVLVSRACEEELDFEHRFRVEPVTYMTAVDVETLCENVYLDTLEELREHAAEARALAHEWSGPGGPCLSIVDVQRFRAEVHVQGYHLLAGGRLVLRSQTLFEHRGPEGLFRGGGRRSENGYARGA